MEKIPLLKSCTFLKIQEMYKNFFKTYNTDDNPLSKDRNASRLLVFGSCTCDLVISYVTAIMTIIILLIASTLLGFVSDSSRP